MLSLAWKVLCIVINFLGSIFLVSSPVYFKNGSEYLIWWDFCSIVYFRKFFMHHFRILSFISNVNSFPIFPRSGNFLFHQTFRYFPAFVVLFLTLFIIFSFLLSWWYHYHNNYLRVVHTNVIWWCFTWRWVTASVLGSLGLFLVFRKITKLCNFDGISSSSDF